MIAFTRRSIGGPLELLAQKVDHLGRQGMRRRRGKPDGKNAIRQTGRKRRFIVSVKRNCPSHDRNFSRLNPVIQPIGQ